MVPESGGVRTVGAISLEVFNPRTDAYERIASDPLRVGASRARRRRGRRLRDPRRWSGSAKTSAT